MKYLLQLLASSLLLVAVEASSAPLMDDNGISVPLPASIDGQDTVQVYSDQESPNLFWWAPYRVQIAKTPGIGSPRIVWKSQGETPSLMVVSNLKSMGKTEEEFVKKFIANDKGIAVADIKLSLLPIQNAEISVEVFGTAMKAGGEWKPVSSLIFGAAPETILIPQEINLDMLKMIEMGADVEIIIRYTTQIVGYKTGANFGREFDWNCALEQLGFGPGMAQDTISERILRGIIPNVEQSCVTKAFMRDEVSTETIINGWIDHFVATGLLQPTEQVRPSFTVHNPEQFHNEHGEFTVDQKPVLEAFPADFSKRTTTLPR